MIMHVKPKRVWSALGWVTATVCKIGGSVMTEVWWPAAWRAWSSEGHKDYGRVCPRTLVDVVRWRGAGPSERTHVKLQDEASLRRGKCSNQYDYDEVILLHKWASFSSNNNNRTHRLILFLFSEIFTVIIQRINPRAGRQIPTNHLRYLK